MTSVVRAELIRFFGTRLWLALLIAALVSGLGLVGVLVLIGPENADPPMPGLDTVEGAEVILGIVRFTLFLPAVAGTFAITSEYRHGTIGSTFLAAPRRGQVMVGKLVVHTFIGLGYGIVLAGGAGLALFGGAALRATSLGAPSGALLVTLVQLAVAAAVHMLLGVAVGALVRHQIIGVAAVLGYFYFVEPVLMAVPGLNQVYGILPGGASAALTRSTWLADTIAQQLPGPAAPILPVWAAALVLVGYAVVAAAIAVALPLRRDLR